MQKEERVIDIIQAVIPAMEIVNTIFGQDKYKEEELGHPKLKILISATLQLQGYLRKALFMNTFTPKDAKTILEFISYKSKIDNTDEFLISSYHRATTCSETHSRIFTYKLDLSSPSTQISSASEFSQMLTILSEVLTCIELALEFPFETHLLNLIEYAETIEDS